MPEGLVHTLSAFAERATVSHDDALRSDAQRRILDVLGNSLATYDDELIHDVTDLVVGWGGSEQASLWVDRRARLPGPNAALVNGFRAHALDFDDTHLPSVLHPSACVVPAALATAEAEHACGADLIDAVAAGIELTVRLGAASYDEELKNSVMFENGLHATAICGAMGAAGASARLLGLDAGAIADAIGIAASMGSGLLEANRTGGSIKRFHCGWAAHAGVIAASLAAAGVTGPPTVLEGRFGLYRAFSEGRFRVDALLDGLGEQWEMARVFFKPYPTNHFTHAGIDGALAMVRDGLRPAEIAGIELGVAAPTLRTIAQPEEVKASPATPHAARFSGPFTVASALVGGGGLGVYLDDFTEETIRDPERLRLAGLVKCLADEESTDRFPHQFGGVLRVTTVDGRQLEHRVRFTRGGPENPLSAEEFALKFSLNAGRALGQGRVAAALGSVLKLHEASDTRELMDSLAG